MTSEGKIPPSMKIWLLFLTCHINGSRDFYLRNICPLLQLTVLFNFYGKYSYIEMLAGQRRRKPLTYLPRNNLFASPEYFLWILRTF